MPRFLEVTRAACPLRIAFSVDVQRRIAQEFVQGAHRSPELFWSKL